jgi:MFS family permease
MSSEIEERLSRIEGMLQDLSERQRISRFDTLMFLMYPLTFFMMPLLTNALLNWKSFSEAKILGVSYADILFFFSVFIGLGMICTLLYFIRAYARDNLRERFVAFQGLMSFGITGFSSGTVAAVAISTVGDLVLKYLPFDLVGWITRIAFILGSMFSAVSLVGWLIWKFEERVLSWLRHNIPLKAAIDRVDSIELSKETTFLLRVGIVTWVAVWVSYGIIVINAIWVVGLEGVVVYHALVLSGLTVLTFALILRKMAKMRIRGSTSISR